MSDKTKTIREQVIDDIEMAIDVSNEIIKKLSPCGYDGSDETYVRFLGIIMDHIHYVFDQVGYIRQEEEKSALKVA